MSQSEQKQRCPLCQRYCELTRHHLIPRKLHGRTHYRRHYSREQLNRVLAVCRQCHNALHRFYDEKTLARQFDTLEAILDDPTLAKHFLWLGKQRVQ